MLKLFKQLGQHVWRSEGPLITSVVEILIEYIALILLLKASRTLLTWGSPTYSCSDLVDCVHTYSFVVVWLMLVLGAVAYVLIFTFIRLKSRVQNLPARFESRLQKVEVGVNLNSALLLALSASESTATFTDRTRALTALQLAREEMGAEGDTHRRLNLLAGRLHRMLGHYDKAVEVLTAFIEAKAKQNERDVDVADAYYNRACYRLLATIEDGKPADWKESAYADLETSFKISPINAKDALRDDDFKPIWEEPRFKKLIEGAQAVNA
jgi:hypothetical protein